MPNDAIVAVRSSADASRPASAVVPAGPVPAPLEGGSTSGIHHNDMAANMPLRPHPDRQREQRRLETPQLLDPQADSIDIARSEPRAKDHPKARPLVIEDGGPLCTLLKDTVVVHDKVVEKRIGMEIQEGNYNAQWKHTSSHLDIFLQAAQEFVRLLPGDIQESTAEQFRAQWLRLQESVAYLQKWQRRGLSDAHELTKLEGTLLGKEEELYQFIRPIFGGDDSSDSSDSELAHSINFEPFSVSSEESGPLEHEYYDKMGDLHLIQERIFNMDADQQRREYQLEQAMKAGEYMQNGHDRNTYVVYVRNRKKLVKEYFDTKELVEQLREDCKEEGIEVDPPKIAPFLDLSRSVERPPQPYGPTKASKINGQWDPDIWLMYGGLDKKNRILLWRDSVGRAMADDQDDLRSRSPSKTRSLFSDVLSSPNSRSPERAAPPLAPISPTFLAPPLPPPPIPPPPPPPGLLTGESHEPEDADAEENDSLLRSLQEEEHLKRRHSAPDMSRVLRDLRLTSQSLQEMGRPRSESGVHVLKTLAQGQRGDPLPIHPLTESLRRRFRPQRQQARVLRSARSGTNRLHKAIRS